MAAFSVVVVGLGIVASAMAAASVSLKMGLPGLGIVASAMAAAAAA